MEISLASSLQNEQLVTTDRVEMYVDKNNLDLITICLSGALAFGSMECVGLLLKNKRNHAAIASLQTDI